MAVNIGLKLFKHELTPAEVVKKSREDRFWRVKLLMVFLRTLLNCMAIV